MVAAMIFFCSGQMIIQTFMNITVPSPPPTRIERDRLEAPLLRPYQASAMPTAVTTMATTTATAFPLFSPPPLAEAL